MVSEYLQELISKLEKVLVSYGNELEDLPSGRLLCDKKAATNRYYVSTGTAGCYKRKGITKNKELLEQMARKEFLREMIAVVERDLKVVRRAREQYEPCDPTSIIATLREKYDDLPDEYFFAAYRDTNIRDLDISAAERIAAHAAWGEEAFESDNYKMEGRTLYTSKGIMMRSKAEVVIAEKLNEYGIPFRYEQPLQLGSKTLHPDFTFEGKDGELFYLEFCGMMDDPAYVEHFFLKRSNYEKAGILEWRNIIYIYATGNELNMMYIDAIVRTRIIPWL